MLPGMGHSAFITPQLLLAKPSGTAVLAVKPFRAETRYLALCVVSTSGRDCLAVVPLNSRYSDFWTTRIRLVKRVFVPLGGGHTYCPGRSFAQREIYTYLTLTFHRFELDVTDSEGTAVSSAQVPLVERGLPAAAAAAANIGPASDVFVTLGQRRVHA